MRHVLLAIAAAATCLALLAPSARAEGIASGAVASAPTAAEVARALDGTIDRLPSVVAAEGPEWVRASCGRCETPCGACDPCDPCAEDRRWRFAVVPYMWMSSVSGDVWVDGQKTDIDTSFFDLADKLTFGAQLYAEATHGRWWIAFDGTYMEFADTVHLGPNVPFPGDYEADMTVLDVRLGYRLWERRCCQKDACGRCCGCLGKGLWAFVGARYWRLHQELEFPGVTGGPLAGELSSTSEWVDPFVGVRFAADLSRRWSVDVRGDVGGFGIGDASEFTWQLAAYASWHFSRVMSLVVGYRAMGVDRVEGSGTDKQGIDAVLHGPVLGLSFRF